MNKTAMLINAGKMEKYRTRFNAAFGLDGVTTVRQARDKLELYPLVYGRFARVLNGDMLCLFRSLSAMDITSPCDWTVALPVGPDGNLLALYYNRSQLRYTDRWLSWENFHVYYSNHLYGFSEMYDGWLVMSLLE